MRHQRTQRSSAPATTHRAESNLPAVGYALIVDGQVKTEFNTQDRALKVARDLERRYPMLQVKVYDAEKKFSEKIEMVAA